MLKIIAVVLLFVLIILVLLGLGGAVLLLLAYGLGLLVSGFAHFEPFQATVLALAAILAAGILAERIWKTIDSSPFGKTLDDEDEYDDYDEYDDDEDDLDEEDDEDETQFINPGIPRWRQPLKQIDFSGVAPDARCPCGSGRKYKNCHGFKKPAKG